jgi:transglutaminase-like putative cysteine protease
MSFVTPTARPSSASPRVPMVRERPPRPWSAAPPHGWLVLILTLLMSCCLPAALDASNWVTDADMVWSVAALAFVVGLLAARRGIGGLLGGLGIGVVGIIVASVDLLPPLPPARAGLVELIRRLRRQPARPIAGPFDIWWARESRVTHQVLDSLQAWWLHGAAGDAATDQRILLLLVAILIWLVVCQFTWAVYARVTPLLALLPLGTVLVTISVLSGRGAFATYLFLPAALLLVARLHLLALGRQWAARQTGRQHGVVARQLTAALCLTFLAGLLAVGLPVAPHNGLATRFWGVATPTWNRLQGRLSTAFQTGTVGGNNGLGLKLGGGLSKEAGRLVMYVATNEPPPAVRSGAAADQAPLPALHYFLGAAYADYSGQGWQTPSPTATSRTGVPLTAGGQPEYLGSVSGNETSRPLGANQPLAVAGPTDVQVVQHIQLAGSGSEHLLFAYSQALAVNQPVTVHSRGGFPDQITLVGGVTSYTVTSSVPQATAAQLRAAGAAYPASLAPYLARPNVPARVAQLAQQWAGGAASPYDQAMAIEAQLRRFPYTLNVPAPPAGRDPVDYFLFDLKRGYCEYDASAMVVLLRDLGVPSRIATGYAGGSYDAARQAYVVTEDDAHSWVQVFFPGIGWVNFEPTPANPELLPPTSTTGATARPAVMPAPLSPAGSPTVAPAAPAVPALLVMAALLLAAVAAVVVLLYRLRRAALPADELVRRRYAGLLRHGRWRGLGKHAEETPLEFAERLSARLDGDGSAAVRRLAVLYVGLQYGAHAVTGAERREAERAWRQARRGLWRRLATEVWANVRKAVYAG